jgi:predicted metal-dependent hydrolase
MTILGQEYILKEQKSNEDTIEHRSNTIIVNRHKKTTKTLLREFLAQILYAELLKTYDSIKAEGKIELFGDFDFEIKENIDGKKWRIAKLKGNKVIIKLNAVALPESALKYILAHELAHVANKRHTKKFWKTVELIYPDFLEARKQLSMFHVKHVIK